MKMMMNSDYSSYTRVDGSTKRTIYRKRSLLEKLIKKFYLKEILIGVLVCFNVYVLTVLCFACCQC